MTDEVIAGQFIGTELQGTFVHADRALVRYFQWVRRFPEANSGAADQ